MTSSPTPPVPRPPVRPEPRHGHPIDADAAIHIEIPDDEALATMAVKEHVVVFEELHRTFAELLDDAGNG